ncbi:MAG TPA: hypothetical protein PKI03_39355 [Pseudomonadota bacterium]|nr:hypothetical protein [Pseudomonadota bacterium]
MQHENLISTLTAALKSADAMDNTSLDLSALPTITSIISFVTALLGTLRFLLERRFPPTAPPPALQPGRQPRANRRKAKLPVKKNAARRQRS